MQLHNQLPKRLETLIVDGGVGIPKTLNVGEDVVIMVLQMRDIKIMLHQSKIQMIKSNKSVDILLIGMINTKYLKVNTMLV